MYVHVHLPSYNWFGIILQTGFGGTLGVVAKKKEANLIIFLKY